MAKPILHSDSATRQQLLRAALKSFARSGYAATSVQEIVDAAQVSKPVLYYYFSDKAHLFEALVDQAHDERYQLMQAAAERGRTVAEKLEEILAALFEFSLRNSELMRLAFATAFAASGEVPGGMHCRKRGGAISTLSAHSLSWGRRPANWTGISARTSWRWAFTVS